MKGHFKIRAVLSTAAVIVAFSGVACAGKVQLTNDVAWAKVADTYKECVQQAYLNAMNRLRALAKDEKAGTWCVVLDADETVISNVQFQIETQVSGEGFSNEGWNAWCQKGEATLLPGAAEFCALARELGGKVIIVTNRKGILKEATLKNLMEIALPFDVLLVREGPYEKDRSKALRRSDIEKGEVKTLPEGSSLPPLKILMLCGDQTHDLYEDGLSFSDVRDRFGKDLVVIPNPMYGDWTKEEGARVEAAAPPPPPPPSEAITWQEAMGKVGEDVVVEGTIVNVYVPPSGPAKLNFDRNWRESLTVAVFNAEKFGDLRSNYFDKKVRVSGKVSKYADSVQIKVSEPSQIEVIP